MRTPQNRPVPSGPETGELIGADIVAACAELEQNDTANGQRLLSHFGADLLHVREVGWHIWAGRLWRREGGDEAVTRLAQRTARRIALEADVLGLTARERAFVDAARELRRKSPENLTGEDRSAIDAADGVLDALTGRRAARRKFSVQSGNAPKVNAMVSQALPHKTIGPGDLDADPLLFNCENVTLALSRVVDPESEGDQHLRYRLWVDPVEHSRAHYITKLAPVVYDPEATCPKWDEFMKKFQPNENVRRFLQVFHGLAMTGLTGAQCFVYNYGTGANGKSTFMEALASLYGGYSDLLNAESITGQGQRRGDQATPDFAELPGVRYLRISELPRGEDLKEALVKSLTGGDEIKARHLNKGFFKFTPCFKAAISGNDMPKIGGTDHGIWRRLRLVKWSVMIPEGERRPMNEVLAEFEAERSGILNWLLEGLDIYMQEGLVTPKEVTDATQAYRDEMDPIAAFIEDCLAQCDGHHETARDVYVAFVRWCNANAIRPWKETFFGRVLPQKGIVKEKTRVRRYLNVKLHDVPDASAEVPAPSEGGEGR
ncbi:phage/plasmid primase, P4 family (plasmid) [Methylobacterium currus]|uniref:DNA primase family protein n=1 Tax=Methylobacterium currus TaxID=2051553 RepID=UPI001E528F9B|nr:phage/plasmid primase, P4 family [Methylobacterium currus]UHC20432.1 phage/plasmid primase, P4 family [Methylobacterium currus]